MERIPVVAKSVKESLITLGHLFLHKIRFTLRWLRDLGFNCALVAESAMSAYEKSRSNRRLQFASLGLKNFSIYNKGGALTFVLEVGNTLLHDILLTWD